MAVQHGSKYYVQLLIDPNRYKLAENLAAQQGKKVTAALRDLVYEGLERAFSKTVYRQAVSQDEEEWQKAVKRRVQGRLRSKTEKDA